jgi:hypothetical protein
MHDLKAKWSVPFHNIRDEIKKYVKARRKEEEKEIFDEMF